MFTQLFLTIVQLLSDSMKDTGNFNLNFLRFFLQNYLSGMIILKLIVPYFHNADAMTIALFLVPIIFISTGLIFNNIYELFTSHKT